MSESQLRKGLDSESLKTPSGHVPSPVTCRITIIAGVSRQHAHDCR